MQREIKKDGRRERRARERQKERYIRSTCAVIIVPKMGTVT